MGASVSYREYSPFLGSRATSPPPSHRSIYTRWEFRESHSLREPWHEEEAWSVWLIFVDSFDFDIFFEV